MNRYTPKKKHAEKPIQPMKLVRVDAKTQIEVPVSIPDDVAIERYYARHTTAIRPPEIAQYPLTKDECFQEIPVGSLEEIEIMADGIPDPE